MPTRPNKPKPLTAPPLAVARRYELECPKCGSPDLERLPANRISPHPGYRCSGCGLRLRARGMLFVYLFALVMGAVVGAAAVAFLVAWGEDRVWRILWLGAAGIGCSAYSLYQLVQPVPRRKQPAKV